MKPLLFGPVTLALAGIAVAGPSASAQVPYLVADIDATAPGASSNPFPIGVVGDRLFFVARRPDVGQDLWTTTGSAASTIPLELTPGPIGAGASGGTALGGALLFHGSGLGQLSLWTSDGTPSGTRSLLTGPIGSDIAVLEQRGFFGSGFLVETSELWTTDGTLGGTRLLKDILPGVTGSHPLEFTPLADRVLFTVNRDPPGFVPGVWFTDGTAEGTRRLVGRPCTRPRRVDAQAFMFCGGGAGGSELWGTDGTPSGTARVANLDPPQGSSLGELTSVDGTLFFWAVVAPGKRLWKSDGTEAGTVQVQDGLAGPIAENPVSLTPSGDVLFFVAFTPAAGAELWRSDGTDAGTYMVRDIVPGPGSGLQLNVDVIAVPGGVVFAATTPALGNELWFSDGTSAGTFALGDIEPGPDGSGLDLRYARVAGGRLYFAAQAAAVGRELWAVDFAPALTAASTSLHEGDAGTSPASFAVTLTAAAPTDVTVQYAAAPGTALPGSDFLATAGTLTFPAGTVGPLTVSVPVLGDLVDEPNEAFSLVLTAASGAIVQQGRADAVILDDDGPSVAIAGTIVAEGDAGTTTAMVTATLTTRNGAPTPGEKTIAFATNDGTATAGVDYDARSGVVTFPAGSPSGSTAVVGVPIRGDTADEPNESFTIHFEANGDETVGDPDVTVLIKDDDGIDTAAPIEIAPGSALRADLAPPRGRAADRDYYVLLQQPQSSYEVVIDEASGIAAPLTLVRVASDGSTVLQGGAPVGTGSALSLRWQNTSSTSVADQHLAVSSASCGSTCGTDDHYRLRAYETTLFAPRFNNVDGQATVVLLQNTTDAVVNGRLLIWIPAGYLGHAEPFTVPAHGTLGINTLALYTSSGSLTVTHDGPYGGLVGKAVALQPATGFSFDTPLTSRPR